MTEQANSEQTPQTDAQRITAISALLQESDDDQPAQADSAGSGDDLPPDEDGGSGSGTGELDTPEHDAAAGLEDDSEDAAGSDTGAVNLKELAAHLELDAADLYELEIPLADGESVTLGQLKDEYKEVGPVKEAQAQLESERSDLERQVLQTRSEINALMGLIPAEMRSALVGQAKERAQSWATEQEALVLEAIPDWSDADKRAADRQRIVEAGAEYGFSEQEITFTQDARTLKMLRDFSNMRAEIAGMRAAAKREPGKPNPPGKPASQPTNARKLAQRIRQAKAPGATRQNKEAVVSDLIRSQEDGNI